MQKTIGILAFQGDFEKHIHILNNIGGTNAVLVRKADDLKKCSALIIPGGESTTMTKLMVQNQMVKPLKDFASTNPIMGTCAGIIMLASHVNDERITPLNLLDISVSRNAYGRQIDSFVTDIDTPFLSGNPRFCAIFIRAPVILKTGKDVEILAQSDKMPVMVRQKKILGLTFHPELTQDTRIHEYFLTF